jgi:hypothetical protein
MPIYEILAQIIRFPLIYHSLSIFILSPGWFFIIQNRIINWIIKILIIYLIRFDIISFNKKGR